MVNKLELRKAELFQLPGFLIFYEYTECIKKTQLRKYFTSLTCDNGVQLLLAK